MSRLDAAIDSELALHCIDCKHRQLGQWLFGHDRVSIRCELCGGPLLIDLAGCTTSVVEMGRYKAEACYGATPQNI